MTTGRKLANQDGRSERRGLTESPCEVLILNFASSDVSVLQVPPVRSTFSLGLRRLWWGWKKTFSSRTHSAAPRGTICTGGRVRDFPFKASYELTQSTPTDFPPREACREAAVFSRVHAVHNSDRK